MNFNIFKQKEETDTLKADNGQLIKKLAECELSLKETQETLATAMADKETFTKQIEALNAVHTKAIADLTEKHSKELAEAKITISDATTSAGKVAASIVASKGLDPETIKVSPEEITGNKANSRFQIIKTN